MNQEHKAITFLREQIAEYDKDPNSVLVREGSAVDTHDVPTAIEIIRRAVEGYKSQVRDGDKLLKKPAIRAQYEQARIILGRYDHEQSQQKTQVLEDESQDTKTAIASHVVIGNGDNNYFLKCRHCGATYTPSLPCPVGLFLDEMASFGRSHNDCQPHPPTS